MNNYRSGVLMCIERHGKFTENGKYILQSKMYCYKIDFLKKCFLVHHPLEQIQVAPLRTRIGVKHVQRK